MQAHFTNVAGCKNLAKNALVRLKLQENGYPIQYKPLTMYVSNTGISKNERPTRGQRKSYERKSKTTRSRRHKQPLPPIMKNERYQPNNPTETRTIPARTQIVNLYSELGINDSTGYKLPISLSTAAAYISPPQRITPGG